MSYNYYLSVNMQKHTAKMIKKMDSKLDMKTVDSYFSYLYLRGQETPGMNSLEKGYTFYRNQIIKIDTLSMQVLNFLADEKTKVSRASLVLKIQRGLSLYKQEASHYNNTVYTKYLGAFWKRLSLILSPLTH